MPSKSLSPEEKAKVKSAIPGPTNKIFIAVAARIYFAHPQRDKWSYGGLQGALAFTYDSSKAAFILKLVDFSGTRGVIWHHELYDHFDYHKERTFFHSFAGDKCMIGIVFADEKDANTFFKKVTNRKVEKATKTSSEPKKVKKGGKIDKSMISGPKEGSFKHVAHVGFDEEKGFTSSNVDQSWISLFHDLENIGVTRTVIEQNQDFIKDFVRQAKNEPQRAVETPKKKPPPPPVPRRDVHSASSPRPPPPQQLSRLPQRTPVVPRDPPAPPALSAPPPRPESTQSPPPPPVVRPAPPPPLPPVRRPSPQGPPPRPPPPPARPENGISFVAPPPPPPPPLSPPARPENEVPSPPPPPPPPPQPPLPPSSSRGGLPPSPPIHDDSPSPPPPLPPPPPPAVSATMPATQPGRAALLDSIRGQNVSNLRRTPGPSSAPPPPPVPAAEESSSSNGMSGGGDLTAALAAALMQRNKKLGDSDEEEEDDDDWD